MFRQIVVGTCNKGFRNYSYIGFPSIVSPSYEDIVCISTRQLKNTFDCKEIVCAVPNKSCKHGFPQAFVNKPFNRSSRPDASLTRLSCPLLVQAVDKLEKNGAIDKLNNTLKDNVQIQQDLKEANEKCSKRRSVLANPDNIRYWEEKRGIEQISTISNSGVAGLSQTKLNDVKCLHAHLSDYLCFGENKIGKNVLDLLEGDNIPVNGNTQCWQQCDSKHQISTNSWWYISSKKKVKT